MVERPYVGCGLKLTSSEQFIVFEMFIIKQNIQMEIYLKQKNRVNEKNSFLMKYGHHLNWKL